MEVHNPVSKEEGIECVRMIMEVYNLTMEDISEYRPTEKVLPKCDNPRCRLCHGGGLYEG